MTCTHFRGHRPLGAMQFYHPSEVQVLHLFSLLWFLGDPEGHSLPILPTCKSGSCALRTAGGGSRGAAQGGHQNSSLNCQLLRISFTRCNFKNLKILSDKMSLFAYLLLKSSIWLQLKSFSQDSWEREIILPLVWGYGDKRPFIVTVDSVSGIHQALR